MAHKAQFPIGSGQRVIERLIEAEIEDLEAQTEVRRLKAADESYRVRGEVDRKRERQQADIRVLCFSMCLIALLVIADIVLVFRERGHGLLVSGAVGFWLWGLLQASRAKV